MFLFSLVLSLFTISSTVDVPPNAEPDALYLSTDMGTSWTNFAEGLPTDVQPRDLIEHDGVLYLSTFKYGFFLLPQGECAWKPSSAGLPLEEEGFFPISLAAYGEVIVMGTYRNGVYYSHDAGANWNRSTVNMPGMARTFYFDQDQLLAGTDAGIWQSIDQGVTWQRRTDDMTAINVLALHNGQIHVARQNGMGILVGDDIQWSKMKSEWAILQLLQQGEYLYAVNPKNEIFRTVDGSRWESRPLLWKTFVHDNLPEALWGGYVPAPPSEQPPGEVSETSRGWVLLVGGGC